MSARPFVLVLYVLSGACGLVYEVVWTRWLSLTFGITVFATSIVLAAFMAGLGLGSWLVARRIDRSRNPLRVYALLETGIGFYALLVPAIFRGLEPLYVAAAGPLEGHFLLFNLVRASIAFAVLLVPTTMMGGTVPAMGRYLVAQRATVGWDVGLLYAMNTVGAVLGCVVAGFVALPAIGISRTVLLTAATNVTIGGMLLASGAGRVGATSPGRTTPDVSAGARGHVHLAALVFAASGFSALAYEVVWTRVLVAQVHNTTYAFTTMLAVFLAGLAVGDALLLRVYDRVRRPLRWLGAVEMLIGLSVLAAAVAYGLLRYLGFGLLTSWNAAVVLMMVRAGVVLLPGALLFGMTFPLVARVACPGIGTLGRDLGSVYAANTLGGIAGSLAAGFLLVPLLGQRGTLFALAALNVGLGAMCWLVDTGGKRRLVPLSAAAALVVVGPFALPPRLFLEALEMPPYHLIYYYEGITDTTGVWESTVDGNRVVTYGDLRGTAGTGTDRLNRMEGHLAHLLHPDPKRSLQIGFGVGNTLAAAALHPEVERLDCVELSPHVRQTASYFWTNDGVLDQPKVHLIVDDGRNYLLRTRERYDVITLEPPDIFTAGVVNLYTEDFYRQAAAALNDGGLFVQWIPIGEMPEREMRMLTRAFLNVFPETTVWLELPKGPVPILLVGSNRPLTIDIATLARRMHADPVRQDLVRLGFPEPRQLFEHFVAGTARTARWVADAPSVTDDHTVVDFSTPKQLYSGFGFGSTRLRGRMLGDMNAYLWSTAGLVDRLREPITPLLVGTPAEATGPGATL
jgi:spermidine synthase